MTDTDVVVKEENALASFDYSGLYTNVEENYEPQFRPWKVKLLQKSSPEVGEVEGALPGKFIVGPMDGTGSDYVVDELNVLLLDYYTGRIANELNDEGKPVDGTKSKRVCGSLDGIRPFFPAEVRQEFESEEDIEVVVKDWRQPELGEIIITPDTLCEDCPMSATNIRDEDKKWLPPACGNYHRILLYSIDHDQALQWSVGSYNVLKPLEGRKRGPVGIRAMSYPQKEGALPAFIRDDGPHAVQITSDTIQSNFGPLKTPVLKYAEDPMTPGQFRKFRDVEKLYSEQKASFLDAIEKSTEEALEDAQNEVPKSDPETTENIRSVLGTDKKRKSRRLAADDDEL